MEARSPNFGGLDVTWPGITWLPSYLPTVGRPLSLAGGVPGGGEPSLLQR